MGFLVGLILGILGVFIYSNFKYMGISIDDIFRDNSVSTGLYELFWMSFRFNFLNLFNHEYIAKELDFSLLLPPLLGWLTAGFVSGIIVAGVKRGILNGFLIVFINLIMWLIFAIIAGANLTFVFFFNLYETGGGLLTGFIASILGGVLGGAITRKYT
ncbi:MAG: hypothetical protein ACTSU2_02980 [Promethearchaeota archaeon]